MSGIERWIFIVTAVILFGAIFVALIYAAYWDWKNGAVQTGVLDDGTIWEWDRFGNAHRESPRGSYRVILTDPERGLGPILARAMRGESE